MVDPSPVPDWLQITAAAMTGLGAIAAAVSARSSLKAANASERTNLEAREALALAIEPTLDPQVGVGDRCEFVIVNRGRFAAGRLDIDISPGRRLHRQRERLAPLETDADVWTLPLGQKSEAWPPPHVRIVATLRYSDERDIARHELVISFGIARGALVNDMLQLRDHQITGPTRI